MLGLRWLLRRFGLGQLPRRRCHRETGAQFSEQGLPTISTGSSASTCGSHLRTCTLVCRALANPSRRSSCIEASTHRCVRVSFCSHRPESAFTYPAIFGSIRVATNAEARDLAVPQLSGDTTLALHRSFVRRSNKTALLEAQTSLHGAGALTDAIVASSTSTARRKLLTAQRAHSHSVTPFGAVKQLMQLPSITIPVWHCYIWWFSY